MCESYSFDLTFKFKPERVYSVYTGKAHMPLELTQSKKNLTISKKLKKVVSMVNIKFYIVSLTSGIAALNILNNADFKWGSKLNF